LSSVPPTPIARAAVPRSLHLALFITGVLWLLAAFAVAHRAGEGIAVHFGWGAAAQDLLVNLFLLFLLLVGFTTLNWIGTRQGSVAWANALPPRATMREEWSRGVVIGWAAALVAVIPMTIVGALHPQFTWRESAWTGTIVSLFALLIGALATEVAFRGFLFRRAIDTIGPTAATLLLAGIYALIASVGANATGLSFIVTFIAGVLFSMAYLRTHALWLGWGLHFAWAAAIAVVFGLPVSGIASYSGVVQTDSGPPVWLTGGVYGPDGALFTAVVFAIAIAVMYRATRDYAWNYTHPVLVPGGYPMDVPPPAQHVAMEQAAAAQAPPLVQITPTASSNGSERPSSQESTRQL
jgi:membrane protease YdiL (CAAX protease family)